MKRIFESSYLLLCSALVRPSMANRTKRLRAQNPRKTGKITGEGRREINVTFKQSQKQPFNYVGTLKTGLVNAESFEIVISVTAKGHHRLPHLPTLQQGLHQC